MILKKRKIERTIFSQIITISVHSLLVHEVGKTFVPASFFFIVIEQDTMRDQEKVVA